MAKIFLIEDDITMQSLLNTLLQMEGFEVLQSKDETAEQSVARMEREKPALAMIDVNLRHANGFDLLKMIRQSKELAEMRVLMSSGIDYRQESLDAGANGFILKPYMPDELIQMIRQTLHSGTRV